MHFYHCMLHTFYRFCLFILSPFYASDKPGNHDFEILKKLVLPDGSVLRAKYPGRPSRDCLFIDPVMDGKRYLDVFTSKTELILHSFSNRLMPLSLFCSLLKIWNMNNCTGVLGIFNCQGAGSWPCTDKKVIEVAAPEISASVSPSDVEYLEEVTGDSWTRDCAIFSFKTGTL